MNLFKGFGSKAADARLVDHRQFEIFEVTHEFHSRLPGQPTGTKAYPSRIPSRLSLVR